LRYPILANGDDGGDNMTTRIILTRTIALPRLILSGKRNRIDRIAGTLNKTKNPLVAPSRWNLMKLGVPRELHAS
jgi:hypothetical protein